MAYAENENFWAFAQNLCIRKKYAIADPSLPMACFLYQK